MDPVRRALPAALPVVVLAFATFLWTMPRQITFEDAGLFHGVCATGGIAHPPGYPLFTLICTPLYWLPVEPVLLGNGLSALFGALAAGTLVLVLIQLGIARLPAAFAGLLLAFSDAFWSQSIIVEVYTLNAVLFLLMLLFCIRFMQAPSQRDAVLIALLVGLGIANHWPLTVLSLPGLALIAGVQWPWIRQNVKRPGFIAMVFGAGLLGLAPYVSLLLKDDPTISYFGAIDSWREFVRYFLREDYAAQDQQPAANITDKVSFLVWMVRETSRQMSWFGLAFSVLAILFAFPRPMVPLNLGLGAIFIAHTLVLVLLLGFDYQLRATAVFRPYPLVAWTCLALWAGIGLDWLARQAQTLRSGTALVALPATLALILTFATNLERNDRAKDWLAARLSSTILSSLPPDAVLVVKSDALTFSLLYQHYVKHRRPDIDLHHIHNIIYPTHLRGDSLQQRIDTALSMARTRPVYSAGVSDMPLEVNYGIYIRHDGTGIHKVARDQQHADFRSRLIAAYLSGEISHPYERSFANGFLLDIAGQLTALAELGDLTAAEAEDLANLQRTAPGLLVTMYKVLVDAAPGIPPAEVARRAFEFEADMPPAVSNSNRALFYYYFAELFLRDIPGIEADPELARLFLLKGFETWPVPENPVVCRLQRIDPPEGHAVRLQRFQQACARTEPSAPGRAR